MTIHVWAKPGAHTLTFRGAWLATRSITLPDGEVIQAVTGFGFLDHAATFQVGDTIPPVPPVPPVPPPGTRVGVIVEETSQRTPAQAQLWLKARAAFEEKRLYLLDQDQLSGPYWSKIAQAVRDKNLGLPVLVVVTDAGAVVRVVACPTSVDALKTELSK